MITRSFYFFNLNIKAATNKASIGEIDKEGKLDNSNIVPFPSMHDYIEKNKDSLKNKKILFYCAHGHRSTLAVQISKSYNFVNCFHLIGGLEKWKKKGLEIN